MNQLTKYILFFLFISISGYSQKNKDLNPKLPNLEIYIPELNDINKVKYVKTTYHRSNEKGEIKDPKYSLQDSEIFINASPYRYLYKLHSRTNDTISKITYKYNENKNTLEDVKEQNKRNTNIKLGENFYERGGYNQVHWIFNKDGNVVQRDDLMDNQLFSSKLWIYNSEKFIIRIEDFWYRDKKLSRSQVTHYLYDFNNRLIKQIQLYNNEITQLKSWKYNEDGTYKVIENLDFEEGMIPNTLIGGSMTGRDNRRYYSESKEINRLYDEHDNWIKIIYKIYDYTGSNDKYSVTEREIIYK